MHELPIAENIRNLAVKHAEKANAEKVTDIYIVIGQLSSVVDDFDPVLLGYDHRRLNCPGRHPALQTDSRRNCAVRFAAPPSPPTAAISFARTAAGTKLRSSPGMSSLWKQLK